LRPPPAEGGGRRLAGGRQGQGPGWRDREEVGRGTFRAVSRAHSGEPGDARPAADRSAPLHACRLSLLVEPHLDVLHRLARRLTRTRADAEDLAQEALMRAFERRGGLRDPARIRGWMLATVRNLHLNRVRDDKPHLLVLAGD